MASRSLSTLVLLACALVSGARAVVDYCNTNTYNSNSTYLQFTKEVSGTEYAVTSKFKSLHCCAKGYRSIEWYKNNRPYPWPTDLSSFILYPEAANQTIYTQRVSPSDRGNYTCRMSNETHYHEHTVILDVVANPPDAPKATFTPADQWVELGRPARLYCEAFVGRINLPDARSDVWWSRVKPPAATTTTSQPQQVRLPLDKVTREDEQILGAYLFISNVKSEDYGQYICTVSNADSFIEMPIWLHHKDPELTIEPNSVPWRNLCFVVIGVILALMTVVVLYAKLGLKLALKLKKLFCAVPVSDGKEYDVLVLHTDVDAQIVSDVLVPTLQDRYNFKCAVQQIPVETENWNDLLSQLAHQSRSLVTVLSPNRYTTSQLNQIFGQLQNYGMQPIAVLLENLPDIDYSPKNLEGHSLLRSLRKSKLLAWRHVHDKHFWLNLRLALPLPTLSFSNTSSVPHGDKRAFDMPRLNVIHMKNSKQSGSNDVLV